MTVAMLSASTAYYYTGHKWNTNEVYYTFDSSIPSSWESEINTAADTWSSVSNADFTLSEATSFTSQNFVEKAALNDDDLAAETVLQYDSDGYIEQAYTTFDSDVTWSTSGESNKIDVQNTAAHEWGHWLELGHSTYEDATMYAYLDYGETKKRTLHWDDEDGIQAIY